MKTQTVTIDLHPQTDQLQATLNAAAEGHELAALALRQGADNLYRQSHPGTPDCEDCGRPMRPEELDGTPRWYCQPCAAHYSAVDLSPDEWARDASPEMREAVEA